MIDEWQLIPEVKYKPKSYEPTVKYVPGYLEIEYNTRYNWKTSIDRRYMMKNIIPDFIREEFVQIRPDYLNRECGLIIIRNIPAIVEQSKKTVEQIGNMIKANLIANMEMPKETNETNSWTAIMDEVRPVCYIFAFGAGIASFAALCVKFGIQF